jgi:thiosulfate/3-mercaptopyruvate sulfurtransferase
MAKSIGSFFLKTYGLLAFLLAMIITFATHLQGHPSEDKKWNLSESWIVSPKQAHDLKNQGALLLDVRGYVDRLFRSLPSAKILTWEEFSNPNQPLKGKLLPAIQIEKKLKAIGIQKSDTLLVFGDPLSGWGEEGRMTWTLRTTGYLRTYLVDGGVNQFLKQGKTQTSKDVNVAAETVQTQTKMNYDIEAEDIIKKLNESNSNLSVIDVREKREFLGSTPYGESRGGHIPSAHWIYYQEFIDKDGYIKSKNEIDSLLKSKNIVSSNQIVSYCTGGIRSAFTTAILVSYGYDALNYSGSMWEWSSKDSRMYQLVKSDK